MSLPHTFKRITLHLARDRQHPEGSSRHGYDIVAPLGADGRIDPQAWRERREACRVRRFWAGQKDEIGHLVHRAGGVGGHTWVIDYDPERSDDDEATCRLGDHLLQVGEYVSIAHEDEMHTFRVISVVNAA